MIMGVKQNVEHINRYRQLAHIMAKHGMGYFVSQMGMSSYLTHMRRRDIESKKPKHSAAVTYRMILEDMGPTFIKFGQILSTRPDIISREYVKEFSKLQDDVNPIPFEIISKQIEKEIDGPLESVFAEIDPFPLASASIGQVHKAILLNGDIVAIKVQKPDIEKTIHLDIEIMKTFARRAGTLVAQRSPYNPGEIVDEFAKAIVRELDYTLEAANAQRFYREFENDDRVRIPWIYSDISTKRLLVMEYIEGIKVSDILENSDFTAEDRATIAEIGAKSLFKMVFDYGFFHADPHPANIFVINPTTISFLDFGIVGKISSSMRKNLIDLVISVINKNPEKIADIILEMTGAEDANKNELIWDIEDLIEIYYGKMLESINMGDFIQDLTLIAKRHGIKMPVSYALLGKATLMIEGVGRQLNPNFETVSFSKPYIKQMIKEKMGPEYIIKHWYENLTQSGELLIDLPVKIDSIISRLGSGNFNIGVDKRTFDGVTHSFERSINRLSFSIVAAAMLLSTAVMISTNVGPNAYGLSIIGWIGVLISFSLSFYLIKAIMNCGRL